MKDVGVKCPRCITSGAVESLKFGFFGCLKCGILFDLEHSGSPPAEPAKMLPPKKKKSKKVTKK